MITSSTSALDFTEKKLNNTTENQDSDPGVNGYDSPSNKTIQAILNYSRNLEVRASKFVQSIEFVKS